MALIPPAWLPWIGALAAAFAADQIFFGGRYIHQILDKMSGNTFDTWTLRPETRFKGRHCSKAKILGYKDRIANNGMARQTLVVGFVDDEGNVHPVDADDLDIPPQALKRWYVDSYDIGLRSDKLKEMQEENDRLRSGLASARTQADLSMINTLDFTTRLTSFAGEWKKNIGSTIMMAQKTKEGYAYQEELNKQETQAGAE